MFGGFITDKTSPASATNNDVTSCKTTSYVVFFVLDCDKSATKIIKKGTLVLKVFPLNTRRKKGCVIYSVRRL